MYIEYIYIANRAPILLSRPISGTRSSRRRNRRNRRGRWACEDFERGGRQ